MILIFSHVADVAWTAQSAILSRLENNLSISGKSFSVIMHFMNWNRKCEQIDYQEWVEISKKQFWLKLSVWPVKYIYEILVNLWFGIRLWRTSTLIAIDPLNALSWVILKKLWFVDICIYYTPDYSPKKFNNFLMNKIYHAIDRFSVRHATEVRSVSSRIVDIRRKMGLSEEKNIFLPNVPWDVWFDYWEVKKEEFSLISSGTLNIHLDHQKLIDSIYILKEKYPKIKLYIAWNWPLKEDILRYIAAKELEKSVILLWYMQPRDYLKKVSSCKIWVAMYSWKWWFNYYWDSTKCREFMYFWLPIYTTNYHSTAEDIRSSWSWIVCEVEVNAKQIALDIEMLFYDYELYSMRSYNMWQKYNHLLTDKLKSLW